MPDRSADYQFIQKAMDLAQRGVGLVSPGPCVGAVIVDPQGKVIGEGIYTYAGKKHAEILSLNQAGDRARGATLFINLEPHAHQGRTPPCTDALIAAGVSRVVASMADPNPKVSGRGFDQLRAAGIQVDVGAMESEARKLNESFARFILHGVPLVTLKSAMTLDAKIAPPPGTEQMREPGMPAGGWITGDASRLHAHELRHQNDAILVGVGTILADNSLLSDRSGHERRRPLLRVILDANLRTPLQSQIVASASRSSDGSSDLLIFSGPVDQARKASFEENGVRIEESSTVDGRLDLGYVLHRLGELEITSLLIEGGSSINASALEAGVVDKVFFYYAPQIMGSSAIPFAGTTSLPRLQPLTLKQITIHRFAPDIAVEGYLHDPYGL